MLPLGTLRLGAQVRFGKVGLGLGEARLGLGEAGTGREKGICCENPKKGRERGSCCGEAVTWGKGDLGVVGFISVEGISCKLSSISPKMSLKSLKEVSLLTS